jgi:hypothetical protein
MHEQAALTLLALDPCVRRDEEGRAGSLERITITRNRSTVPGDRVNPLYINRIEQIHILLRNREAIPQKDDLL